jgi:hypothetical protein
MERLDELRLDLSLVSSILNHAGFQGLLNYISLETYKKLVRDEYVNYTKFQAYSFMDEKSWVTHMEKLVEMKLAVKTSDHYITRSKLKDWKQFINANMDYCLKFNGYLVFDVAELYKMKDVTNLKDLIFLSIVREVIKGKSISRKFIRQLTGCDIALQKRIEERNEEIVEKISHHVPLKEYEGKKIDQPLNFKQ